MTNTQQNDSLWNIIERRIAFSRPAKNNIEDWLQSVRDYYHTLDWNYGSPSATLKFTTNVGSFTINYISGTKNTNIEMTYYEDSQELHGVIKIDPDDITQYLLVANTLGFDFYNNKPTTKELEFLSLLINSWQYGNTPSASESEIQDFLYRDFENFKTSKEGGRKFIYGVNHKYSKQVFPELYDFMNQFTILTK
jgi:hypothetical protein